MSGSAWSRGTGDGALSPWYDVVSVPGRRIGPSPGCAWYDAPTHRRAGTISAAAPRPKLASVPLTSRAMRPSRVVSGAPSPVGFLACVVATDDRTRFPVTPTLTGPNR